MLRSCSALTLFAGLLMGCQADTPHDSARVTASKTISAPRYPGESALVLLYARDAKGDTAYLCSGAFVTLDDPRSTQPGILTASHCFAGAEPDTEAFLASFDNGNSFHPLTRAWIGDHMSGADIAFAIFDPSLKDALRAYSPLDVALPPTALAGGDAVWTWGNPDDQGRALTLGYVMNPEYQKPPISGTIEGNDVMLDLSGYIVAELNIAPGSSGGTVLAQQGVIGVVSSDFMHSSGFRTTFVTPVARLKPLLAHSPKSIGKG
jgi:hypothetical protein